MVNINPQWPILGFISRLIRICRLSVSSDSQRTMKLWARRALYITQVARLMQQSTTTTFNNAVRHIATAHLFWIAFSVGVFIFDAFFSI